ncbi:MAG: hypothetical protein WCL50_14300, partial [Spirochaetota bacterium]
EFDLFVYESGRFASAGAIGESIATKLTSKGQREDFIYEGRKAVFVELAFALGGEAKQGYAVAIAGRAGNASVKPEPSYALVAWTGKASFESYTDFILSCLDCFSIDRVAKRSPGPVSQYILAFPATRQATKKVSFGSTSFELPWNADEGVQVSETAGREFRIVEAYGSEALPWREAWARCYRMIYRESARRLDQLVASIDPLLPDDPTDAARTMLNWVQGFHYERDQKGIDFIDPLTAASEGRGDCDSRAMVMALVLERRGIDTVLMLSRDYSHAMAAVDVSGGGQRFPFAGKEWLVAETTAKVGLGMIAADQVDWKKWVGVSFSN